MHLGNKRYMLTMRISNIEYPINHPGHLSCIYPRRYHNAKHNCQYPHDGIMSQCETKILLKVSRSTCAPSGGHPVPHRESIRCPIGRASGAPLTLHLVSFVASQSMHSQYQAKIGPRARVMARSISHVLLHYLSQHPMFSLPSISASVIRLYACQISRASLSLRWKYLSCRSRRKPCLASSSTTYCRSSEPCCV